MASLSSTRQLYNDFWLQYKTALPKYISYFPNYSPFNIEEIATNEFKISIEVDFKRLKYKSSSHKKPDIAIRIKGTQKIVFKGKEENLTESNVNINYLTYDESKNEVTLIESLHYDYEINREALKNHPIFHCQFCNDVIRGNFFDREYNPSTIQRFIHGHIRIPTANMDMISILLSIAADHFTPKEFERILDVYDKKNWHLILPHNSHFNLFKPNGCYRSRAWYISPP